MSRDRLDNTVEQPFGVFDAESVTREEGRKFQHRNLDRSCRYACLEATPLEFLGIEHFRFWDVTDRLSRPTGLGSQQHCSQSAR